MSSGSCECKQTTHTKADAYDWCSRRNGTACLPGAGASVACCTPMGASDVANCKGMYEHLSGDTNIDACELGCNYDDFVADMNEYYKTEGGSKEFAILGPP